MDRVSVVAICLSGALIFTTIQAQDFADVQGDAALGRVTFPIYAPELSRVFTLFTLIAWSCGLSAFWEIGPLFSGVFIALGVVVGWRYYVLRTPEDDNDSYVLYNVSTDTMLSTCPYWLTDISQIWLMTAHILPANARTRVLSF